MSLGKGCKQQKLDRNENMFPNFYLEVDPFHSFIKFVWLDIENMYIVLSYIENITGLGELIIVEPWRWAVFNLHQLPNRLMEHWPLRVPQ